MSIVVTCASCGSVANVPDDAAGKRGKCRGCGAVVQVPSPSSSGALRHSDVKRAAEDGEDAYGVATATAPEPEQQPSTGDDDLLFCEACNGHFAYDQVRDVNGRVICRDCSKAIDRRTALAKGELPDDVRAIIAVNPWILVAYVTGFCLVGVPVQIWVMVRLLKAMDYRPKWPWIAGVCVPLVGLVVLWYFTTHKAQPVIDECFPRKRPLTLAEEIEYGRLVQLGRIGTALMFLNGLLSFCIFGVWAVGGVIGLVGLGVCVVAAVKQFPYNRKIKEAGAVKLWFADSKAMQAYKQKIST